MLRLIARITFTQVPRSEFPGRNKIFSFDFVNSCEIISTWQNLTDTAKLTFPRKIYVKDSKGQRVDLFRTNLTAGQNPVLLRGDKIKIELGYTSSSTEPLPGEYKESFNGFVTKINPRMPAMIECEDRMYQLKQVKAENKFYQGKTIQFIISELIKLAGITDINVVSSTSTGSANISLGDFRTQNETIAEVLQRIQKDYNLYSYFRGNDLRIGIVYYPQDRNEIKFEFQKNIISDNLEFRRREDVNVGISAYSLTKENVTVTNQDGTQKTKKKRIEAFVDKNGKANKTGFQGEIVTRHYWDVKSEDDIVRLAKKDLVKYYYTGVTGDIETFGEPLVKHGDAVVLTNPILPEMNGTYLIKQVQTGFGVQGFRQKITLHFRIDVNFTKDELQAGI